MKNKEMIKDFVGKVVEQVLEYNLDANGDCIEIHQFDHYGEVALEINNNLATLTPGTPGRIYRLHVLNDFLSEAKMEESLKTLAAEIAIAREVFKI